MIADEDGDTDERRETAPVGAAEPPDVRLAPRAALRLAGVLPGWATLLILAGIVGGALVGYVLLLGDHERHAVTDRATEETKLDQFTVYGRTRADRGSGYDGR